MQLAFKPGQQQQQHLPRLPVQLKPPVTDRRKDKHKHTHTHTHTHTPPQATTAGHYTPEQHLQAAPTILYPESGGVLGIDFPNA